MNLNFNYKFISVFEILLKVSEGRPWKETFLDVLPQRKFVPRNRRKKTENGTNSNNEAQNQCDEGSSDDEPDE